MRLIRSILFSIVFISYWAAAHCLADNSSSIGIGTGSNIPYTYAPANLGALQVPGYYSPPVVVPDSPYERPERLYILPVFLAPAGEGHWLPDRSSPGFNLNGQLFGGAPNIYSDSYPTLYARAANNMSVHLQTARLMYERAMRNPLNGKTRGTFELASWDEHAGLARKVVSPHQAAEPLVMELENFNLADVMALTQVMPYATPYYVEEILDKIGCHRMSCPFVLVIALAGNPIGQTHGLKWNYGYNNGGGTVFMDYSTILKSWDTQPPASHIFLSTIVHELGHAFGMPHTNDYCSSLDCDDLPYLSDSTGLSIMSNNPANWILGCPRSTASDPKRCQLPSSRVIATLPGKFVREDMRVLDANALVFPDFEYLPALDHPAPNDVVRRLDAGGDNDITTTERFYVESSNTVSANRPSAIIGGYSERFAHIMESDGTFAWQTDPGDFGSWAQYHIRFPETIFLERVSVYGGRDGGNHKPAGLQLFVAGDPNPIAAAYNLYQSNVNLNPDRAGSHFILQVQRSASGIAELRGLRFFGKRQWGIVTEEFYPPAEPVATTLFGSTFGGSINNIVGTGQLITDGQLPFQPASSWHSSRRDPGSWVSVDVAFPEETDLTGIMLYTGHTSGVHRAAQIQIERQCVCRSQYAGQGGTCGMQSAAACSLAGGDGEQVYEVVYFQPGATADTFVAFPKATSRHWRMALRTLSNAGPDGWMVVRGFRFWGTGGVASSNELFPPGTGR